jgi:hypothetical protein
MDTASSAEMPWANVQLVECKETSEYNAHNIRDEHGKRFLTDELLGDTSPSMSWNDFMEPLLRKFPKYGERIRWMNWLGLGIEGGVWKAHFDDSKRVYALKVVRTLGQPW